MGFDAADWETRHPATVQLLRWFDYEHLAGTPREVSKDVYMAAMNMAARLPDGPELTAGLRKPLEAKDCFVRASIDG